MTTPRDLTADELVTLTTDQQRAYIMWQDAYNGPGIYETKPDGSRARSKSLLRFAQGSGVFHGYDPDELCHVLLADMLANPRPYLRATAPRRYMGQAMRRLAQRKVRLRARLKLLADVDAFDLPEHADSVEVVIARERDRQATEVLTRMVEDVAQDVLVVLRANDNELPRWIAEGFMARIRTVLAHWAEVYEYDHLLDAAGDIKPFPFHVFVILVDLVIENGGNYLEFSQRMDRITSTDEACEVCGRPFEQRRSDQVYCGPKPLLLDAVDAKPKSCQNTAARRRYVARQRKRQRTAAA